MSKHLASVVRDIAEQHRDVANPKDLVPLVMDHARGHEREILAAVLPQYIAAVLRRRTRTDQSEAELWDAFLSERVPTADGYVFARDATANDLEAGAERRVAFAGNLDRRATQYRETAAVMRRTSTRTAGDLSRDAGAVVIATLEMKYATIRHMRRRAQRQTGEIDALQRACDLLRGWIAAKDSPTLQALRQMRSELQQQRDELRDAIERGMRTDAAHG